MYLGYQAPIYELSVIVTFEFVICEIILTSQRRQNEIKSGERGGGGEGGGCGAENNIGHSIFFSSPLLQQAIKGGLSRSSRRLLELSNMHAPSFVRTFALANILAISTGSIMSANVF